MSEININYKGSKIAGMDASGTKTLLTQGKYCEDNISVVYSKPAAPTPSLQAKTYTVDSAGTATVTADSGYDGLSSVQVSVPSAGFWTGITDEFYSNGNTRMWKATAFTEIDSSQGDNAGFIPEGHWDGQEPLVYIAVPSGTTVTPTESSQTIGGARYMMEGAVTVNAIPSNYVGSGITQRSSSDLTASGATVTVPSGYYSAQASKAVASGTAGTPIATKGTVSNHSVSVTPSVTNTSGYISGGTINGTAVTVSASELVSGTYTVNSSGTKDVTNYASASVPAGTAGTPSASKGAVSNHSVSVTPSVTNTTGYITGSTKTGTAVTVSASELVSGNKAITENGTNIDVTNYATVSVSVSGGGGSNARMDSNYNDTGGDRTSISFYDLLGEPTSFAVYANNGIPLPSGTPYKVSAVVYDGTGHHAQILTNTSNAQASYDSSSFSHTYSNGTLTVTSTGAHFTDADWILFYSYNGTSANVHTADVQVGSGATSITFTGLEDEPIGWYLIFKSNFSTSSGYQRVIFVGNTGTGAYDGLCMDSQARFSASYWTGTYSNGSLTITSQGTNAGGYFHQPGYYQLTYVLEGESPYERVSKTYRASTSSQTLLIEPSTGYEAMSQVSVTIPAITQTNLVAGNIKSGTTVTINNGQDNLWSVTGTYSGGGGSANIATATMTNSSNQNTSISFTLPSGRTPKAFFARLTSQIARNSNSRYYYVFDMRWDGSSTGVAGNTFYMSSGTLTNVTSGYSYSQTNTTFTLSSTGTRSASPGSFYNGTYELVYIY